MTLSMSSAPALKRKKDNQKLLDTSGQLRDRCFEIASRCCDSLKKFFSSVGATSRPSSYDSGDTGEALSWAEKELGELETIINARRN